MPEQAQIPGRWNRRQRDWGTTLWIAFLVASGGTVVLFALVDPLVLSEAWEMGWETSVRTVYAAGFVFLFVVAGLAAWLTSLMIRTGPGQGHADGSGKRPPPQVHDPADNNPDLAQEDWK